MNNNDNRQGLLNQNSNIFNYRMNERVIQQREEQNDPVRQQQAQHHQNSNIIDTIGVSKTLGNKVFDELDSRTTLKFQQLREQHNDNNNNDDSNDLTSSNFEEFFKSKHNIQFNNMQSLQDYKYLYNININEQRQQAEQQQVLPRTPKKQSIDTIISHNDENNNNNLESLKRFKTNDSTFRTKRRSIVPTATPVSDITRRIRRLRLRTSIANKKDVSNNDALYSIMNTPLSNAKPLQMSSSIPQPPPNVNVPQHEPTFLKPTINFLNKMKRSEPIFKNLNTHIKSKNPSINSGFSNVRFSSAPIVASSSSTSSSSNSRPAVPDNTHTSRTSFRPPKLKQLQRTVPHSASNSILRTKQSYNNNNIATKSSNTKTVPESVSNNRSVFDRLYTQSTISRSTSTNTIKLPASSTNKNRHTNITSSSISNGNTTNSNKISTIKIGRSKTSGTLSSSLSSASSTSSTMNTIHNSKSNNNININQQDFKRPVWR
ncbi:She1p NDAI_0A05410 [Naumovozyma dairenensis CBS 421]|uniref:Uncharacterized protein n=1 Tax=Naumovozyma dairenensis (strain ATCC 10597 / BCRC 20456 / CBS 421 / NBRC 0211 / NRRL Y-12639) TaxID=1071378 RepID=G0W4F8_NAUDC|nr:hypothetical protein NDAI_0A05410 [Naumovozyma dairenensis CBS 421]CCD22696.1 hypothetical protein NDAI_0A05410 [Naumovozyma dairenensis CBS 421]